MPKNILQKAIEFPARSLDSLISTSRQTRKQVNKNDKLKKAKNFWHNLGPGLITGAADDDPSGIATYSQTGAQFGFQFLWLSLFTFPLMSVVQEMCARIGLVTGRGLAANIRNHYPKWVLLSCTSLLFIANTLNLGADLGAMAKAVQLLKPELNFVVIIILFAILSLWLQIFTTYDKYSKYLKWLTFVLFSYVAVALMVKIDWQKVFISTIIPTMPFTKESLFLICGILGTTISPYLFFWQTSQEIEEEVMHGKVSIKSRSGTTLKEVRGMRIDVWSGMFVSNIIMFFIIASCAATLFSQGITQINTAADAAKALQPIAGEGAYILFAAGIIGTGMLAIPVLAGSSSYAISESFGWKFGLYRKLKEAYAFYGVIIVSTIIGIIINIIGIDPVKTLIYSAVVNGIVAPVMLLVIVQISSNQKIMGKWANGKLGTSMGWFITGVMTLAGLSVIVSLLLP